MSPLQRPPPSAGVAPTPAPSGWNLPAIQRLPWWLQLAGCVLVVAVGTAIVRWLAATDIPRPDLSAADPRIVLAIDEAEARVRSDPRSAEAWGELGLVLHAQAHAPQAVACFRRATALDDRSWRWPFFAAAATSHIDPVLAVDLMEEAIRRDPRVVWPHLLRGEWLVSLGRSAEARGEFEAVLARSPEQSRARVGLARLLLGDGDPAGAAALLTPAFDDPTTRRAARQIAAQAAARRGDDAEARSQLAAAQSLPPDTPWPEDPLAAELPLRRAGKRSRIRLAADLDKAGARAEADAVTRRLEEEHPEVYLYIEGRRQLDRGDAAAAERALRQAVEIDPDGIDARYHLGRAIAAQRRTAEAATTFRALVAVEPSYGPGWLELGRSLLDSDPEAALEAFGRAAAYMPGSVEAAAELDRARRRAAGAE